MQEGKDDLPVDAADWLLRLAAENADCNVTNRCEQPGDPDTCVTTCDMCSTCEAACRGSDSDSGVSDLSSLQDPPQPLRQSHAQPSLEPRTHKSRPNLEFAEQETLRDQDPSQDFCTEDQNLSNKSVWRKILIFFFLVILFFVFIVFHNTKCYNNVCAISIPAHVRFYKYPCPI